MNAGIVFAPNPHFERSSWGNTTAPATAGRMKSTPPGGPRHPSATMPSQVLEDTSSDE